MKVLFFILVVVVAGWIGKSYMDSRKKSADVKGGGSIKLPGSGSPDTSKEDAISKDKPL
jgi:hypothetical protein